MMCPKLLRLSVLSLLTALPLASRAQDIQPLTSDPSRVTRLAAPPTTAQRGQALALPFFDDFTSPVDGPPNPQKWEQAGGVLVSNRFAFEPPTRGAATLDGLQANGQEYGITSGSGLLDVLVSQPIDLSGRTAADLLYLGFYWQAGNIFSAPTTNSSSFTVAFQVEFKDNAGNWQRVWRQLNTSNIRTPFRRKFLAINDARYFHSNFQFRFRAIGNVTQNKDSWNVDYVKLAPVRQAADSLYQDVATSRPLSSLLARGTALPVWQYNAASNPSALLNPAAFTTINNLSTTNIPVPGQWQGTLQVLPAGPVATFATTPGFVLSSPQFQARVEGDLRTSPIPVTPEAKIIRHQIALTTNEQNTNPLTLNNDTIARLTELRDYFAYDDGTPEATVSVRPPGQATNFYAQRFDLNQPDQVRSILISPAFPSAAGRRITLNVWDTDPANNNAPTAMPKATVSVAVPASLPAGQIFLKVDLPTPVPVSGQFYIGYGHGPIATPLSINIDLNNVTPPDASWQFTQGRWEPLVTASLPLYAGWALMLRPVMNNNVLAVAPASVAATYALYPNPSADGRVQVQGRYARALVLDALGRVAWQQPQTQQGQSTLELHELPAGLYVVQLTLADGLTVAKRLVLTR